MWARHRQSERCAASHPHRACSSAQDGDEFEPVDLPDNIAEKVAGIDQEKIDFLRGEGALNFAERHDILFSRLEDKSPEAIEAYVDAMMRVVELLKFDPETDMESIPLNTESPYFNYWKTERPAAFSTPRQPGPINVRRYLDEGNKLGIPTFFNMPIDQEKIDFLRGEGALNFAERHDILFSRLEDKSPEAIEAYVDAMMRVVELLKFDPETDMESIPLNTESPYFNYWKTERPAASARRGSRDRLTCDATLTKVISWVFRHSSICQLR